jgi:hypothetical protein
MNKYIIRELLFPEPHAKGDRNEFLSMGFGEVQFPDMSLNKKKSFK